MPLSKYKINLVILLFFITLCMAMLGLYCRTNAALSLFWPCNAMLLGLLVRFPQLSSALTFPAIYVGLVTADIAFGTHVAASMGMDAANLSFIVTGLGVLLTGSTTSRRLQALNRVFPASVVGAAVCAVIGSVASQHYFHDDLVQGWISWFCEQVSTSILLLPVMITLPRSDEINELLRECRQVSPLPLISLGVSIAAGISVGGGGSLIFPLPALMWCAVSYPLFITCLLTLITGITEIILVASNVLTIQGRDDFFLIDSLASARLGVAAMTVSPLIVALSATANKKLVARITRRADYDLLTGALTRSGLAARLDALMARRDHNFNGAAFVVDIDRFKNINDTFGHAAGDYVLAQTVERIRQTLQQTAIISRMGGEEFLILIEDISLPRAFLLANRLRQSIEQHTIILNDDDLSVTISIGISSLERVDAKTLDEAIKSADKQLYLAKSSGRNRVCPEVVL
ncbi:diguanylate cyclase (GGDEF)-like protein [Erwinia persicina]|jgi:diguanylate cyclase (GGDEF)-like protein|uniref:diguanylate cyclase n=2 Tax=Erwinia TaxID=551 RepID=A0ABV4E8S3_9GAMM|nr:MULTISPECIES: sensor domain-containing diguanylate cyclase [Erwinia]MCP1440621.1 diguanylate cyclase (GGDEF)-like protein [Erwinia persicina]MDN4626041.1 diguanylate cyclase [Erwinia sp. PsM31]MDN8542316.1 diguanylate cyclase [Erwinia sp. BC051422]